MANNDKGRFGLNKNSDRHFDISKGSKRKFDLSKDTDEPAAAAAQPQAAPKPVAQPKPEPVKPAPVMEPEIPVVPEERRGKAWLWVILAILVAILLVWWLMSGDKKEPLTEPAIVEEVAAVEQDSQAVPADSTPTEVTAEAPAPAQQASNPEPGTSNLEPSTSNPEPSTSNLEPGTSNPEPGTSNLNVDAEARKVIQGLYGNNPQRRNALGENYPAIQKRVNELMRRR